jgi:hypothetical protein
MHYLTNYYRNLCEQLQEKINILEAEIRSPDQIRQIGEKKLMDAVSAAEATKGSKLSPEEYQKLGKEVYGPYVTRSIKREELLSRATSQLRDIAASGDVKTAEQLGDVMKDVNRPIYTGKVAGLLNLDPEDRTRLKNLEQEHREAAQINRKRGIPTNVPADVAAMRKVVELGTGRWQAPYPQPTDMTPDFHDGPDSDNTGSTEEIKISQTRNQYRGNLR